MAQIIFAGTAGGTTLQFDANFAELYGFAKNLNSSVGSSVGIGITPSVAYGTELAISGDAGAGVSAFGVRNIAANSNWLYINNNAKNAGAFADTYWVADEASKYEQINGVHIWSVAPAGSPGAAITWVEAARLDQQKNFIQHAPGTPPTLAANGQLVMNLTSNTNLRISARGSDGVTRVANITLA